MSDLPNNHNNEDDEESFADLLESYSPEKNKDLRIGDKISGEIIAIGSDKIFIDTGTKIDGVVEKSELLDDKGELAFKTGDVVDLFVVALNENTIELSRGFTGIGSAMLLQDAFKNAVPVEGKVESQCKGGFNVTVMGKRAFCPISQIDVKYVENPEVFIGSTYFFQIVQYEEKGRNIVVSRREILRKAMEKAGDRFYETVTVGDLLEGQVTRIAPFGVFVELLPNIEGMVHISELSWSKIMRLEDIVKVGDRIQVKVMGMEKTGPAQKLKISLSLKQVTADPWLTAGVKLKVGEKVRGIVTRCADFGAFVEIEPGIEGMIHISEMSYTKRVLKPEDVVSAGDTVSVMIKDMDIPKKRISLSLRDAEGDPWMDIQAKYPAGRTLKGTIEKKESYGLFISLEPGITGLLPKSKLSKSHVAASIERLREGEYLPVIIEALNPEDRKITLAPADAADTDNWQEYAQDGNQSLGSLGEKLQAAMKRKTSS